MVCAANAWRQFGKSPPAERCVRSRIEVVPRLRSAAPAFCRTCGALCRTCGAGRFVGARSRRGGATRLASGYRLPHLRCFCVAPAVLCVAPAVLVGLVGLIQTRRRYAPCVWLPSAAPAVLLRRTCGAFASHLRCF